MTRPKIPLDVEDISLFARGLARELPAAPGHLALLNMLARAAGYRNFQHLRAQNAAADRLGSLPPRADLKRVEAALRCFDAAGQMVLWPAKTNLQHLCMWGLWSRLPVGDSLSERQISALLAGWHLFGDAAILRRTLVELGLVTRSVGASVYQRVELPPPADAQALIRALHLRLV